MNKLKLTLFFWRFDCGRRRSSTSSSSSAKLSNASWKCSFFSSSCSWLFFLLRFLLFRLACRSPDMLSWFFLLQITRKYEFELVWTCTKRVENLSKTVALLRLSFLILQFAYLIFFYFHKISAKIFTKSPSKYLRSKLRWWRVNSKMLLRNVIIPLFDKAPSSLKNCKKFERFFLWMPS